VKDNQYLSRYASGETRFPRLDATPWSPFEEDGPPVWAQVCWGLSLAALVILLASIPLIWLTV
jgi:hypothetical protein